jgi:hypothetical protein
LLRKSREAPNARGRERVFFVSEIQATDATFTGCRAKRAAAHHAPGMERSSRILHTRIAATE